MSPPVNRKQVMSFFGAVNLYKSTMRPMYTLVLAPLLSRLTEQVPFVREPTYQYAFDGRKVVLAIDFLNMNADLNKPFAIACNTSDSQL